MENPTVFLSELRAALPTLRILENEPLSRHCSFRIGGACTALLPIASVEEAETVCRMLRSAGEEPLIIGNGTNLLITDEFLPRIVIQLGSAFSRVEKRGDRELFAEAGTGPFKLANFAADSALTGLEFAQGIPGTLGGAVCMNAGAYDGEMKDVLRSVLYLDEELNLRETEDLDLSYRHSRFSDSSAVVLGAAMTLREGSSEESREKMKDLMARRRKSQPLDMPSAGSTFKRPVGGYAAALIDQAGLKGFRVGGAQVSEKHAGFVVNAGGASFDDVIRLMDEVRERVFAASGITLEPEVKIIRG